MLFRIAVQNYSSTYCYHRRISPYNKFIIIFYRYFFFKTQLCKTFISCFKDISTKRNESRHHFRSSCIDSYPVPKFKVYSRVLYHLNFCIQHICLCQCSRSCKGTSPSYIFNLYISKIYCSPLTCIGCFHIFLMNLDVSHLCLYIMRINFQLISHRNLSFS